MSDVRTSNTKLPFQRRVLDWMMETFSMEVCRDTTERNHRFLEESLELVQAMGGTQAEAHMLVDYVFGRPVGEPEQEVGGVMVTLSALCSAADFSMAECGDREVARCWLNIEKIRAKQAGKPKHSPLPGPAPETNERLRRSDDATERFSPGQTYRMVSTGKMVELERKLTCGPRALWVAKWVGIECDPDCSHTEVRENEISPLTAVSMEVVWQIMYRLADLLDADQFNNIEALVQAAGVPYPPERYDGRLHTEMCEGASVRGAPGTSMETALEAFAVLTGGETRVGWQIRLIPALLIGELQVGAAVSETGHTYIALGPITGDEESAIEIDGIEAQALHEWLGKALEPHAQKAREPLPEHVHSWDGDQCHYCHIPRSAVSEPK